MVSLLQSERKRLLLKTAHKGGKTMVDQKEGHVIFLQQIEPDRWLVNGVEVEAKGTSHLANMLLYVIDYDLPYIPQIFECLYINAESDCESRSDALEVALENIPVSEDYVCKLTYYDDDEVDYVIYKLYEPQQ
jgi:hypothetical protein